MKLKKISFIASSFIALLAVIFWFVLPAMTTEGLLQFNLSFVDATFGRTYTQTILGQTLSVELLKFSLLNLIGLILLIVSLAFHLLQALEIKLVKKYDSLITATLSFLASIFIILIVKFTVLANDGSKEQLIMQSGVYIIFVLSLLAGIIALIAEYMIKNKKVKLA